MPRLPKNLVKRGRMYYFRMEVGGKQIKRSLGSDLQEARRRVILMRQEVLDKRKHESEAPAEIELTVAEFSSRWLQEFVESRRKSTRKGDGVELARFRMAKYILPVVGGKPLSQVDLESIQAVRRHSEDLGRSPQTVKHILGDLRCLLRFAVHVGALSKSPSFSLVMPRIPQEAPKELSDVQVERILEDLPPGHEVAVRLALYTGLRWGEIRSLQWRHVYWSPRPHLVVERTKSGKVRRVPLSEEAVDLLKEVRSGSDSLFVVPESVRRPEAIFRRSARRCGFRWHFHQLRHTFACRWLRSGGSKESLQKILGHSTITVTERYGALSDEAVFAEAERIEGRTTGRTTSVAEMP